MEAFNSNAHGSGVSGAPAKPEANSPGSGASPSPSAAANAGTAVAHADSDLAVAHDRSGTAAADADTALAHDASGPAAADASTALAHDASGPAAADAGTAVAHYTSGPGVAYNGPGPADANGGTAVAHNRSGPAALTNNLGFSNSDLAYLLLGAFLKPSFKMQRLPVFDPRVVLPKDPVYKFGRGQPANSNLQTTTTIPMNPFFKAMCLVHLGIDMSRFQYPRDRNELVAYLFRKFDETLCNGQIAIKTRPFGWEVIWDKVPERGVPPCTSALQFQDWQKVFIVRTWLRDDPTGLSTRFRNTPVFTAEDPLFYPIHFQFADDPIYSNPERLISAFAHEFCHVATQVISRDYSCAHTGAFLSWSQRLSQAFPGIVVEPFHRPHQPKMVYYRCRSCGNIWGARIANRPLPTCTKNRTPWVRKTTKKP